MFSRWVSFGGNRTLVIFLLVQVNYCIAANNSEEEVMCQSASSQPRQQGFKLKPVKIQKSAEPRETNKEVDLVPEWNRVSVDGIETSRRPNNRSATDTSGTSLEPIYFDALGNFQSLPPPASSEERAFEHYQRLLSKQNPVNSFYSVDEQQNYSPQQSITQTDQSLTPILLKSFPPQHMGPKQIVERPRELDFRKLNFETIQQAINNFSPIETPPQVDSHGGYFSAKFKPEPKQQSNQHHYHNMTQPGSKLALQQLARTPVYKPSVVVRPKVAVNLSSLLRPGEAMISEKEVGEKRTNLGPVSSADLRQLFKQLEPMALKESEKPETTKIKLMEELDELNDNDEDFDDLSEAEQLERLRELRRRKKLNLVLPTSHLFGGSLGVVNESRINQANSNEGRQASEEQISFLKSLAKLSSNLQSKAPSGNDELDHVEQRNNDNSIDHDDFFELARKVSSNGASQDRPEVSDNNPTIPIDVLVDHLMSSSRVASFGLQHGNGLGKGDTNDESDEDEDSDDQDKDNNGTLPPEADGHIDAYESAPGHRVLAPTKKSVSFNSVLNKSDSWVPLDSVASRSKMLNQHLEGEKDSKKLRKIRSRKKRIKRQEGLNLIIGNRKLSRRELMRLIVILNKMASQKEPSKERAACRKLLRFLVKLAIEQHKKNKESKQTNSEDQFIRSLLNGPASLVGDNNKEEVIELKTLGIPRKSERHIKPDREEEPTSRKVDTKIEVGISDIDNKRGGSLRDMTDELENYFDSDFFEDMADKLMANNKSIRSRNENTATSNLKRSKAYRRPYALPVPIYGHQLIEDADEDDVELDYVRIPTVRRAPKFYNKPQGGVKNKPKPRMRPSPSSVRSRRSGRKKPTEPEEESEEAQLDTGEQEEEEDIKRKRPDRRQPKSKLPSAGREGQHSREPEVPKEEEEDEEEEEPIEPGQDDENGSKDEGQQQADDETIENSMEPRKVPKRRLAKKRKLPVKSKTKKRKTTEGRRRKKLKKVKIDLDSRYEIPAPIEKGKAVVALSRANPLDGTKLDGKSKRASSKVDSSGHEESTKRKHQKANSKNITNKNKAKHSIKNRSTFGLDARKKKLTGNPEEPPTNGGPTDEAREPNEADSDYYNEGTSYSKVCDDDGRCKVSVESNSPKLKEAIKTGDKPGVEKHLDRWASSDGD